MLLVPDIHIRIREFADRAGTGVLPNFQEEHFDLFYNEARRRYIRINYGDVNKVFTSSFESKQSNTDRLDVLVHTDDIISSTVLDNNDVVQFVLPNDNDDYPYLHYLSSKIELRTIGSPAYWTKTKPVKQDSVEVVDRDPFNKSTTRKIKIYFQEGSIYAIKPSNITNTTIDTLKLTYLRDPKAIDNVAPVEDIFREEQQTEIIEIAKQLILENVESLRQNTNIQHIQALLK